MANRVNIDWNKYHTHDEMTAGLRGLMAEAYPNLARHEFDWSQPPGT